MFDPQYSLVMKRHSFNSRPKKSFCHGIPLILSLLHLMCQGHAEELETWLLKWPFIHQVFPGLERNRRLAYLQLSLALLLHPQMAGTARALSIAIH